MHFAFIFCPYSNLLNLWQLALVLYYEILELNHTSHNILFYFSSSSFPVVIIIIINTYVPTK